MKDLLNILKGTKYIKKPFFIYIVFALFTQITIAITPLFYKEIVGVLENSGTVEQLTFWASITFFIVLFSVLSDIVFDFVGDYLNESYWVSKMKIYREKILNKDYENIINEGTGKLITKIERGLDAEQIIYMGLLHMGLKGILRTVIVLIILYSTLPLAPLIFVVIISLVMLLSKILYKYAKIFETELSDRFEKNSSTIAKIVMENILVKTFNKKKYESKINDKNIDKIPMLEFKSAFLSEIHFNFVYISVKIIEVGIYFFMGLQILEGTTTFAEIVLVTTGVTLIRFSSDSLVNRIGLITKNLPKYYRLKEFIDKENKIIDGNKKYKYKVGEIEFKNIDFGYIEDKGIFNNFSLKILAGKQTAFVGHSGSGKSTLVKLLLRLYIPNKGGLFFDNQKLSSMKIETLYNHIGYLSQDSAIFDGTIRENLCYGFNDSLKLGKKEKDKLIWKALKVSGIDELVKDQKNGLDTEIGERGLKLSGGERQRLSIARVFLKDPEIIILDEPTSALDSVSEAKITKSLEILTKNKTVIIIAHRLQTVMNADNIVVMEKGKVREEGSHKELLKKGGIYSKLVDLQKGTL